MALPINDKPSALKVCVCVCVGALAEVGKGTLSETAGSHNCRLAANANQW